MPKPSQKTDSETGDDPMLGKDSLDETSFEEALERLEGLVREMEAEQMPLESLIQNYEEGTKLFQLCEKRLDEAEGRIEIIRKNRNGNTVVEPFDEGSSNDIGDDKETAVSTDESKEHGELF